MFKIIYKYLFEIQILHAYYLTSSEEEIFFNLSEEERYQIILDRITNNNLNIWNDLLILPLPDTKRKFRQYRMKLKRTELGFLVGIEVKPRLIDNGEIEYHPYIPVTEPLELNFAIHTNNNYFNNFSNIKLQNGLPSIYHFNNYSDTDLKTSPSLSLPVAQFIDGQFYEMGEMAIIYDELKQAIQSTESSLESDWQNIYNSGYVNENDKRLLPHTFHYRFPSAWNVKQSNFILKDTSGVRIKSLSFSDSKPFTFVLLDFSYIDGSDSEKIPVPDGIYDLEISIPSRPIEVKRIFINQDLYDKYTIGVISISTDTTHPLFRILREDGTLDMSRTNSDGSSHPIFELRFKNRITYWRYRSSKNKKLQITELTEPFLEEAGNDLHSKKVRPMQALPSEFSYYNSDLDQIETIYLPNPKSASLRFENNGKIYSDIYTSGIDGLIEEN